jgi:hypothetical protein
MQDSARTLIQDLDNKYIGTGKSTSIWLWVCDKATSGKKIWIHIDSISAKASGCDLRDLEIVSCFIEQDPIELIKSCDLDILIIDGLTRLTPAPKENAASWKKIHKSGRIILILRYK